MLVVLWAARRVWDAEQRAAIQSRGASAPPPSRAQRTPKKNPAAAQLFPLQNCLSRSRDRSSVVPRVGTVIRVAVSLWATRLVRTSLYEVSALDPWVFVAVTAGILVTMRANYVLARRAARIDPVAALRRD